VWIWNCPRSVQLWVRVSVSSMLLVWHVNTFVHWTSHLWVVVVKSSLRCWRTTASVQLQCWQACSVMPETAPGGLCTSIVHSKLDYCNSLYYNIPKPQINRLQQTQNCLARPVVKASKSSHITPILRSLHWLKINERIEYKLLSLTYKVLTTSQPDYLHNLISVQSTGRTRSSSVVSLARPSHLYLPH